MFQKCSKPNSGLTLVEVIFSLVLVGTLMVTLLMAHRRNTDQLALAEKQLVAIDALDQMMGDFYKSSNGQSSNGQSSNGQSSDGQSSDGQSSNGQASEQPLFEQITGEVPGNPELRWRRFVRNEGTAGGHVAVVLRVEVFAPSFREGKTLADVEVITSVTSSPESSSPETQ